MKLSTPKPSPGLTSLPPADAERCAVVEEWAELQFNASDIAFQIEMDESEFGARMRDPRDPYGVAFRRGRLRAESAVAKSLYQLARQGSSPAQKQFLDRIEKMRASDEKAAGKTREAEAKPAATQVASGMLGGIDDLDALYSGIVFPGDDDATPTPTPPAPLSPTHPRNHPRAKRAR